MALLTAPAPRTTHRLATMFEPRSIALAGTSEKSVWSTIVIRACRQFGYASDLFAVNRQGVDVAFLLVPQGFVLDALAAGIRNAVILSSGYAEVGGEGIRMQEELLHRARELGVTIWEPSTLGFNNIGARTPVSAIAAVQPIFTGWPM